MKRETLNLLLSARANRQAVALITNIASGEQRIVTRAAATNDPLAAHLDDAFRFDQSGMHDGHFINIHNPPLRLVIIGAVHIAQAVIPMAQQAGYDVIVFHATGSGGRAMEGLIVDGFFCAVLDVTTTEWCDEVVGGVLSAGPGRLSAAGRAGIPQVVSVGALDMVNFGAADTVPARFVGRTLYNHNATVTLMRTTADECREIGRRITEQLNRATGPVVLVLPLRGVSMLDAASQPFHDPEANRALFDSLHANAGPQLRIREIDAHINDSLFADALVDELLSLMPPGAAI